MRSAVPGRLRNEGLPLAPDDSSRLNLSRQHAVSFYCRPPLASDTSFPARASPALRDHRLRPNSRGRLTRIGIGSVASAERTAGFSGTLVPVTTATAWQTRSAAVSRASCSQNLMTVHPDSNSSRSLRRSRAMFSFSFSCHHCRFARGRFPCSGHPCQKHPSTKMARRALVNTMSARQ